MNGPRTKRSGVRLAHRLPWPCGLPLPACGLPREPLVGPPLVRLITGFGGGIFGGGGFGCLPISITSFLSSLCGFRRSGCVFSPVGELLPGGLGDHLAVGHRELIGVAEVHDVDPRQDGVVEGVGPVRAVRVEDDGSRDAGGG